MKKVRCDCYSVGVTDKLVDTQFHLSLLVFVLFVCLGFFPRDVFQCFAIKVTFFCVAFVNSTDIVQNALGNNCRFGPY